MKTAICKIEIDDGYDVSNLPNLIEGNIHIISRCTILDQTEVGEQIYQSTKKILERLSAEAKSNARKVIVYKTSEHAEVDFSGVFCEWGCGYEEFEAGPGNSSLGIIEDENGKIHMVWPPLIKFVKEIIK